jgi:hypothetical protein
LNGNHQSALSKNNWRRKQARNWTRLKLPGLIAIPVVADPNCIDVKLRRPRGKPILSRYGPDNPHQRPSRLLEKAHFPWFICFAKLFLANFQ